jgi:hypothetical protein
MTETEKRRRAIVVANEKGGVGKSTGGVPVTDNVPQTVPWRLRSKAAPGSSRNASACAARKVGQEALASCPQGRCRGPSDREMIANYAVVSPRTLPPDNVGCLQARSL